MEWIRLYESNSSASKLCVYTISEILSYKENIKQLYVKSVFEI